MTPLQSDTAGIDHDKFQYLGSASSFKGSKDTCQLGREEYNILVLLNSLLD